jgi:hypothetical protein
VLRQPQETQTLYAELSERLSAFEAGRNFAWLKGGFAKKRVANADYWYFKTSETASGQREYSVGPDTPATKSVIEAYRRGRPGVEEAAAGIGRVCAMLRQGGAMVTDAVSARVISALAHAGVFRLGGVLVGTHAFIALGNVLGVRWSSGLRTQDIDLLADPVLQLAIEQPEADVPRALESLNLGFLPVPGLDARNPETSFKVRGKALRVDLLTPARGRRGRGPVYIPRLKASAQPVEFIEYLLEEPLAVPIIDGGATLVNVPDPARFALHKLVVSVNRPVTSQAKSGKDSLQAAELIEVLMEDRPGDIEVALDSINRHAKGWRTKLRRGMDKLPATLDRAKKRLRERLKI